MQLNSNVKWDQLTAMLKEMETASDNDEIKKDLKLDTYQK
jgi:hypothetical protein